MSTSKPTLKNIIMSSIQSKAKKPQIIDIQQKSPIKTKSKSIVKKSKVSPKKSSKKQKKHKEIKQKKKQEKHKQEKHKEIKDKKQKPKQKKLGKLQPSHKINTFK